MADVKIVDIDNIQWNVKDQEARNKNAEQDTTLTNLATEINETKSKCERFYYNADTERSVLQNRINAMLYCYNKSKNGVATIRYSGGYYYNVIMPSADLSISPTFVEIEYFGNINIYHIQSNTVYELIKTI